MHDQVYNHFAKILSKHQHAFRKGCSMQQYLIAIIDRIRKIYL